jgi:hypothetical protein
VEAREPCCADSFVLQTTHDTSFKVTVIMYTEEANNYAALRKCSISEAIVQV